MGAAGLVLIPSYISASATVSYALTLFFGINAIILSIVPESRRGAPAVVRRLADRLGPAPRKAPAAPSEPAIRPAPIPAQATATAFGRGLDVDNLTVRFGGFLAVDKVALDAPAGRITGLIGPNGAGKSTVFNSCSGLVRPRTGVVRLHGRSLGRLDTPSRARRGLGRTFQQMELFDSMTTVQNVSLGREAAFAGWNPLDHVRPRRWQRAAVEQSAGDAMRMCGITDLADIEVGALSTGQRRLVELARCLAGSYDVLLLDEPSSGLDRAETRQLGEILRRVVFERQVGILLVEHDMALVNGVCDHIYVIDFGKPIFEGTPEEIVASPLVRKVYLGGAEDDPRTDLAVKVEGGEA
jgi:ABC-type branched-subunit amino acid transport system ATPase component